MTSFTLLLTYNFAVNYYHGDINKKLGIYDLLINYSYHQENISTFSVLTFMQVRTDKNKQIKNIDTFSVLTVLQAHTDNNKFMQINSGQG